MGEAKRRQKLDPNYGIYNPEITIAESPMTNNFLILVDGYCIDSTIHIEEAEAVKRWIEEEHQVNPMKRIFIENQCLHPWIANSPRYETYPTTTAEILAINQETGQLETLMFTV